MPGTLDPGASCTVTIQATPTGFGVRNATFTASATPGGSTDLLLSVEAAPRLTVSRAPAGVGDGTVTSVGAGISCGDGAGQDACSALFSLGTSLALYATTDNGGGNHFTGWGGGCAAAGSSWVCGMDLLEDLAVTATFAPIDHNLVFVTSGRFRGDLGGATAYDGQCNLAATAAGVNDLTGDAYVAWMSDDTSTAVARLGAARGWERMDGLAVTDSVSDLLAGAMWRPILLTEHGDFASYNVWTGTLPDGSAAPVDRTCRNWTPEFTGFDGGVWGMPDRGGPAWTYSGSVVCSAELPIYCLMKTKTDELIPPATGGHRIWVSRGTVTPSAGLTSFDDLCASERRPSARYGRALVAQSNIPASNRLEQYFTYVTVDSQLIGTGEELRSNPLPLRAGIWQHADGAFLDLWDHVLTGATALNAPADAATTCDDWASATGTYAVGAPAFIDAKWFFDGGGASCDRPARVYCFEE